MSESALPRASTVADTLEALARRCETEEASRELDCRIAASFDHIAAERLADPSASFNILGIHTEGKTWAANYSVLRYTTSLDAAVTLVPDDHDWIVGNTNGHLTPYACVGSTEEHFGATPVLSLCAAALRARAALAREADTRGKAKENPNDL